MFKVVLFFNPLLEGSWILQTQINLAADIIDQRISKQVHVIFAEIPLVARGNQRSEETFLTEGS